MDNDIVVSPAATRQSVPAADGTRCGRVSLVGAGPGDPRWVTTAAKDRLRQADVVIYDSLVNPVICTLAPSEAEFLRLGTRTGASRLTPRDIQRCLRDRAREGQRVVRLKGGDPAIFGRLHEEIEFLTAERIPFEVIPGITSASALTSCAGISLTQRDCASAVAFVTGQEDPQRDQPRIDFAALARFPGTLVFYMGVASAEHWVQGLLDHGVPPNRPAVLVRRCSFMDQGLVTCTLAEIPQFLRDHPDFTSPVLAVVGECVSDPRMVPPLTELPLSGHSVLLTRAEEQIAVVRNRLQLLGAFVVPQPMICIEGRAVAHLPKLNTALEECSWLVFLSANVVDQFLNWLRASDTDLRSLVHHHLAVIGPATAERLAMYGLRPDCVPPQSCSESLAQMLLAQGPIKGVLLLRGNRGNADLATRLEQQGIRVREISLYSVEPVTAIHPAIPEALREGCLHWIFVSSCQIAEELIRTFGDDLRHVGLVTIGPRVSRALLANGFHVSVESQDHTMEGMVKALVQHLQGSLQYSDRSEDHVSKPIREEPFYSGPASCPPTCPS